MSRPRLLIVEDEERLVELLVRVLEPAFEISLARNFTEFWQLIQLPTLPVDVVVLDRMMNSKDTLTLLEGLKTKFPQCAVLILSAVNTPSEKAAALDLGADDYLSKPFANEELVARLKALARRTPSEIRLANITLNIVDHNAFVNGQPLGLPSKEFLLLRGDSLFACE